MSHPTPSIIFRRIDMINAIPSFELQFFFGHITTLAAHSINDAFLATDAFGFFEQDIVPVAIAGAAPVVISLLKVLRFIFRNRSV